MIALAYQGRTIEPAPPVSRPNASTVAASNVASANPKVSPPLAQRELRGLQEECTVVDGDTLRCGSERVRLIGIDAPELPGHCRVGRHCVEGDPFAASDALRHGIAGRDVKIERMGFDRYGRTLANVYVSEINVACQLISEGNAQYVERWDEGGRVAAECNVAL